ncbi:cell division protein ZapA [Bacillus sp. AGMB 02131]|uniref:Cell division protein ZapA n=1 Tax=Peribacillus faecalis TaxID=2772559 RepID=A0A927HAW6_9BACI|nr:cell division protein ZapA [Peribacillus faecalis]MBD3108369.1 cell division protein ZapA [Peribacillus faecalis]
MSDNEKNKITVDIYGQQYTIVGTESASHIRLVASLVDSKMREIAEKNPTLDISRLAVLTAVNTINDYIKLQDQLSIIQMEQKKEKD